MELSNSGENWSLSNSGDEQSIWTSGVDVGTGNCPFDHLLIDVTVPRLLERLDETFFTQGFLSKLEVVKIVDCCWQWCHLVVVLDVTVPCLLGRLDETFFTLGDVIFS